METQISGATLSNSLNGILGKKCEWYSNNLPLIETKAPKLNSKFVDVFEL